MDEKSHKPSLNNEEKSSLAHLNNVAMPVVFQMEKIAKAINPMGEALQEMNKCMAPILDLQKTLKMTQPVSAQIKALAQSAIPATELAKELSRKLNPIVELQTVIQQCLEPYKNLIESVSGLANQLGKTLTPWALRFHEYLERVPVVTKASLLAMAENGWFVDPELTLDYFAEFLSAHENGDVEEIEAALMDFFDGRCDEIEKAIIEQYPKRAAVLGAAFLAHRTGQHELSVPVFLAQADGISYELVGKHYFLNNERKDIAKYVNAIVDESYNALFLSPLRENAHFPISKPNTRKKTNIQHLNRHAILHGDTSDYGTRGNSLKALSFLNYIAVVFGEAVEQKEQVLVQRKPRKVDV